MAIVMGRRLALLATLAVIAAMTRGVSADAAVKVTATTCSSDDSLVDFGCESSSKWRIRRTQASGRSTLIVENSDGPVAKFTDNGLDIVGDREVTIDGVSVTAKLNAVHGELEVLRERFNKLADVAMTFENGAIKYGNKTDSFSCKTIKQSNPGAKSGAYTVSILPGPPQEVYCDMDADGGGWMLAYQSNGLNAHTDLNPGSGVKDLNTQGRVSLALDTPVTQLRFQFGHQATSKRMNVITPDDTPGKAFLANYLTLFAGSSPSVSSVSTEYVKWIAADGNSGCSTDLLTNKRYHNIYWPTNGHTWLIAHTSGVPSGTMYGTSYNRLCDQDLQGDRRTFPGQWVRVWLR